MYYYPQMYHSHKCCGQKSLPFFSWLVISYVLGIFLSFGMMLYTIWYNTLSSKKGRTSLKYIHIYTHIYLHIYIFTHTYTAWIVKELHVCLQRNKGKVTRSTYSTEILCPCGKGHSTSKERLKVPYRSESIQEITVLCYIK